MSEAVTHRMMMLRPMQAGLSGYARLQGEAGRQLVQINLRGLSGGEMRAFWYMGEGLVREVGRSCANPRGEAALSAEIPLGAAAPRRLMALLITDGGDRPRPLAIGLCTAQSAGGLMDAKNALLALCDKLSRQEDAREAKADAARAGAGSGGGEQAGQAGETGKAKAAAANRAVIGAVSPAAPDTTPIADSADDPAAAPSEASKALSIGKKRLPRESQTAAKHGGKHSRPRPEDAAVPREVFLPAIEARSRPERRRFRREAEQQEASRRAAECPEAMKMVSSSALPAAQETASASGRVAVAEAPLQPVSQPASRPASPCAAPAAETPVRAPAGQGRSPAGLPADRLPALQWPTAFQSLAAYFDRNRPLRLMNWPGWRFVYVPAGRLWVGYRQQDGRVRQVAYALPPDAQPPQGQPFLPARGAEGQPVQLLVLDA